MSLVSVYGWKPVVLVGLGGPTPPQDQEHTQEPQEPRDTLQPERSPPGSPMPKLRHLQIHLHRLPDFMLPPRPQRADRADAHSRPKSPELVARPAASRSPRPPTEPPPAPPLPVTPAPAPPAPAPPGPVARPPLRTLQVCLYRLPPALLHSHLHKHTSAPQPPKPLQPLEAPQLLKPSQPLKPPQPLEAPQPPKLPQTPEASQPLKAPQPPKPPQPSEAPQLPQAAPNPPQTDILTNPSGPERPESEAQAESEVQPSDRDETVQKNTPELPHAESQEEEEQEDDGWAEVTEEEDAESVNGTVLQHCPRTDPQYVLHPQNPAESASLNTVTGSTNGFPQKGLLQNKYKIRVDFKVSALPHSIRRHLRSICFVSSGRINIVRIRSG